MEEMKKFFAGLKSVLIWFLLLTYPIVLILLIPIFGWQCYLHSHLDFQCKTFNI